MKFYTIIKLVTITINTLCGSPQIVKALSCYKCAEQSNISESRSSCYKLNNQLTVVKCAENANSDSNKKLQNFCFYSKFLYQQGGYGSQYGCTKMKTSPGVKPKKGFSQCVNHYEQKGKFSEGSLCFCYGDKCNDPKTAHNLGQKKDDKAAGSPARLINPINPSWVLLNTSLMIVIGAVLF